ncbi:MAG: hypothetical protein Q8R29_00995 [bacterium]|nr:hypothetical protein [bacterium]
METITSRIYKPAEFSAGQVHEMLVTLGRKGFSPEMAAEVANTKSGKAEQIVGIFPPVVIDPVVIDSMVFFQKFYHDFCGLEVDFSGARVPEPERDFTRVLGIPQGLTPNQMLGALEKHFPCWRYIDDLDAATQGLNEREPVQNYFIRVRNRREADEEHKNKSANQIRAEGLTTETLLERLVHEGVYFYETGQHPDIDNITLCTGSRDQDGDVPCAGWRRGKFGVDWYDPGGSGGGLRSRQAVS